MSLMILLVTFRCWPRCSYHSVSPTLQDTVPDTQLVKALAPELVNHLVPVLVPALVPVLVPRNSIAKYLVRRLAPLYWLCCKSNLCLPLGMQKSGLHWRPNPWRFWLWAKFEILLPGKHTFYRVFNICRVLYLKVTFLLSVLSSSHI